jgi:2-polyprenyl-3-methyl-5-hydroxy-6-metoxy-1,4-benzoquinol methylase
MADDFTIRPSSLLEEAFHDQWAGSEDVNAIDVKNTFTACTSPELRSIFRKLGDLHGKKVLDVGCGLGEASVFFAMQGADVTATDLSGQMLQFTERLAAKNGVTVRTHKASADSLDLPESEKFDVIYVGNLFHHVDIEPTIQLLRQQLKPDGVLTSWDPLAYNPLINAYRRMATDVRTPDEHPLTRKDLNLFKKNFERVEYQYFWFFTLIIFVLMYLFKGQNPNKVRYWKKVVDEANYWKPLYRPLEILDRVFLTLFPFMGLLCWNVVIFAKGPKESKS